MPGNQIVMYEGLAGRKGRRRAKSSGKQSKIRKLFGSCAKSCRSSNPKSYGPCMKKCLRPISKRRK